MNGNNTRTIFEQIAESGSLRIRFWLILQIWHTICFGIWIWQFQFGYVNLVKFSDFVFVHNKLFGPFSCRLDCFFCSKFRFSAILFIWIFCWVRAYWQLVYQHFLAFAQSLSTVSLELARFYWNTFFLKLAGNIFGFMNKVIGEIARLEISEFFGVILHLLCEVVIIAIDDVSNTQIFYDFGSLVGWEDQLCTWSRLPKPSFFGVSGLVLDLYFKEIYFDYIVTSFFDWYLKEQSGVVLLYIWWGIHSVWMILEDARRILDISWLETRIAWD